MRLFCFHHYQGQFNSNSKVGKSLIFIGRRTLDIYLLHYFFIYSNLPSVLPNFASLDSPFMEIVVSFAISVTVVVGCLLVSSVLRSSPILAHFLFGQKNSNDEVGVPTSTIGWLSLSAKRSLYQTQEV